MPGTLMNPPVRPKAIAFDLDGTLLDHEGRLHAPVADGVRRIADSGIRVFIVTGRLPGSAEPFWRELGLDTPLACANGARVGRPGETPLSHASLDGTALRIILGIDAGGPLHFNYAVGREVLSLKDGPERAYYTSRFCPVIPVSGPEEILARELPTKCLCITAEEDQPAALALLRDALGSHADLTTSNRRFIEIMPPGIDKGLGLDALANWLGVATEDFAAVGDAMNDLPMLAKAGLAVSFAGGDPRMADQIDVLLPQLWEGGMEKLIGDVLALRTEQ